MKIFSSVMAARGSFKRQIILAFVVGFFLLVSAFSVYLVNSEKEHLYSDSSDATTGLAQSLAVSSLSWVLANDVVGLQEVVQSFQNYPELRYAMVISPTGRVLAHSDATKVGQFVADPQSLALLKAPPGIQIVKDDASIADVAVPVSVNGRPVGWARVALGRENIAGELREMIWSHAFFVLSATLLALLAALLIANRLGSRIGALVKVAGAVQAGNLATRARIPPGEDEITALAGTFNQMLDALALNEERLRTASLYTRSLIEASLDPLVTISAEGKITDVNQATENVTGRNRTELIGTDFSDYFTAPDKAREGYQQVFLNEAVTNYPLVLRHRDGHITEVLYNASIYRDEAGDVLGVFAAARDVTERKHAEDQITELNRNLELRVVERTAQLEAANKELEAFSYSVSHDLRTPLRAIDGFSHILLEDYTDKLDDEGKRLLKVVRDNTSRMGQLIDDILKFSRSGRLEIASVEINMEELTRAVCEELRPTATGHEVQVEIEHLPPATGDRSMMRQVLVNLLSNAFKFTRFKEVARIKVGSSNEGNEVIYFVQDNGVGFDMQYVGKLFGVFQRLHGVNEFEGTGIGLAIVKRIVTRHGGRVWAQGKVNEGATIYFALPTKEKDHG